MKAIATRIPNITPYFISDHPRLFTLSGSDWRKNHRVPRTKAGTKAKIIKGETALKSAATTKMANNTGCARKKTRPRANLSEKRTAREEWMQSWTKWIWLPAKIQLAAQRTKARSLSRPVPM